MNANFLFVFASSSIVDVDGTVFIQLGIFLVMVVFLNLALFRPILRLIEARRESTESAREQALKLKEQAATMAADVDRRIKELRKSSAADRDQLVDRARTRDREIMTAVRTEASALLGEARAEMIQLAATVRSELKSELPAMSAKLANRVLGRQI